MSLGVCKNYALFIILLALVLALTTAEDNFGQPIEEQKVDNFDEDETGSGLPIKSNDNNKEKFVEAQNDLQFEATQQSDQTSPLTEGSTSKKNLDFSEPLRNQDSSKGTETSSNEITLSEMTVVEKDIVAVPVEDKAFKDEEKATNSKVTIADKEDRAVDNLGKVADVEAVVLNHETANSKSADKEAKTVNHELKSSNNRATALSDNSIVTEEEEEVVSEIKKGETDHKETKAANGDFKVSDHKTKLENEEGTAVENELKSVNQENDLALEDSKPVDKEFQEFVENVVKEFVEDDVNLEVAKADLSNEEEIRFEKSSKLNGFKILENTEDVESATSQKMQRETSENGDNTSPTFKITEDSVQAWDVDDSKQGQGETVENELDSSNQNQERTESEVLARALYEQGKALINSTNSLTTIQRGYQRIQEAAQKGNADAEIELAFAQLLGLYRPLQIDIAQEILKRHSVTGHPRAQAILGFMYASGMGVKPSQGAALMHWTFSAMKEDELGQLMLAYRYWAGVGVERNCEKALPMYKQVASKVASGVTMTGGMQIAKVKLQDEEDNPGQSGGILDDDLLQYYQFVADKGDAPAQVMLGQLYLQGGRGVERDHARAFDFFTKAAEANDANAQAYIGKIYAEGSDTVDKDDRKAFEYFEKAAAQKNMVGQAGLGLFYLKGRGVQQDYAKAVKYVKLSAEQGWPEGLLYLGSMYFDGEGFERDYKKAFEKFSHAAQNGHLLALYHLAEMHAQGVGVARSCNTAAQLFKSVCERGAHSVMFEQAYSQYKSLKIESSFATYLLLAEMGHEVAQSNAAFMLDRGIVSDVYMNNTDARALQLWSRSATQGDMNACIKLGDYHYYGRGTPVDYPTAASHYRTASTAHKSAQAYFNLGYMHEQGLGFERDIHLAKRHYDMASAISVDGAAPVAIALVKLNFLFVLEALQKQTWWSSVPSNMVVDLSWVYSSMYEYWDLYAITIMCILIASIVLFHRRRQERLEG